MDLILGLLVWKRPTDEWVLDVSQAVNLDFGCRVPFICKKHDVGAIYKLVFLKEV